MSTASSQTRTKNIVDSKQLVTTYLRYGGTAKPFKTFAYAELAAKALYNSSKPSTVEEVATEVAGLLGVQNVSRDLVGRGLSYLEEIKEASDHYNYWLLTERGKSKCKESLASAARQRAGVLARYYPKLVSKEGLARWFADATAAFFGHHGDDWIASASRKSSVRPPRYKTLDQILVPSIRAHGLGDHQQELLDGFLTFLQSENTTDQQYFMHLAHAMFAARLVAADIGADPITLNEIRGAKFVLDTNVLFALALGNRRIGKALEAFGAALSNINAKPVILRSTREEYMNVLSIRRNELLKLVDQYPAEIIEATHDDFLEKARSWGCTARSDYERFFTSLADLPDLIENGPVIVTEDDEEIEKTLQEAASDEPLKYKIQDYCLQYRRHHWVWKKEKSDRALSHDAGLLKGIELLRQRGEKCWVLSLDKSLQILSLQETSPQGLPVVMSVDAMIEILALNGAGPESNASDYAPLLASTIINNCVPREDTYTTEDLHWLHSIDEHTAEMPVEKIDSLLRDISRARIAGRPIDDPDLQAKVTRTYQKELASRDDALEAAKAKSAEAQQEARAERQKRQSAEAELLTLRINKITWRARRVFAGKLLMGSMFSAIIGYGAYVLSGYVTEQNVFEYIALVTGFMLPLGGVFYRSHETYKEAIRSREQVAQHELDLESRAAK